MRYPKIKRLGIPSGLDVEIWFIMAILESDLAIPIKIKILKARTISFIWIYPIEIKALLQYLQE